MTTATIELDLDGLRGLARRFEPTVSVYLAGASLPPADTAEDWLLRLRAVISSLREQGADPPTVTAVEDYLQGLSYPTETAIFAAAGQIRWAHSLPGGVHHDLAVFDAPPVLSPVLAWVQRRPAYVLVLIDRTGADITTVRAGAIEGTSRRVAGPDDEIERNAPGGWAQARYHRRAEDSWLHNAAAVGAAVKEQLIRVHSDLVIMAGDIRSGQLLSQQLNRTGIPPMIEKIPGGRRPDGSDAHRSEAVQSVVDAYVAAQQRELLRAFTSPDGLPQIAVAGAEQTLSALATRQVETLLIVDTPNDDRTAWFDATGWCGIAPEVSSAPDAARGRLSDIAIRSALLSNAHVWMVSDSADSNLIDGLGALCRYP